MRRLLVLAGLVVAGLLHAGTAAAQVGMTVAGPVTAAHISNEGGSDAPEFDGSVAGATTVRLGAQRTLLTFADFGLEPGETLHFEFDDPSQIVLLRVQSGEATVGGVLTGRIGAGGPVGGSVWMSAPGGIAYGSSADVQAGGLVATTAPLGSDDDFVADATSVTFAGAPAASAITTSAGADLDGHGGTVGLLAPNVAHAAGASTGVLPGATLTAVAETEVLYGSARAFELRFAPDPVYGPDLLRFDVPDVATGGGQGQLQLFGATDAGEVLVSAVASSSAAAFVTARAMTASGVVGDGGDIVVAAGGDLGRNGPSDTMVAELVPGAAGQALTLDGLVASAGVTALSTENVNVTGLVAATGDVLVDALGDLQIGAGAGRVQGATVALAAASQFVNDRGPAGVDATDHWVIYAEHPDTSVYGGLDSGNRARWNANRASAPPSSFAENQYVFVHQPALTFSATAVEKTWGQDATGDLGFTRSDLQGARAGVYLGDDVDAAYSGAPTLSSSGTHPGALVDDTSPAGEGSPYAINIGPGTLASPNQAYRFEFVPGTLTVKPVAGDTPPVIAATLDGDEGDGEWFTSDVAVAFAVTDAQDMATLQTTGCGAQEVASDTAGAVFACTATARGRRRYREVTVKRDATPPVVTAAATSGGRPYAAGAVADQDVRVTFTCTDALSGVAGGDPPAQTVTAEGTTASVQSADCRDAAGNVARGTFGPVRIARPKGGDGGGSGSGGGGAPPGGAPGGGTAVVPPIPPRPDARTRALLERQLRALRLRLRAVRRSGYTRRVALEGQAGTIVEELRLGRTVLARGTARIGAAGSARLAVRLTRAGRRALRRRRSARIVIRSAFTPPGARPIVVTRALTLR